MWKKYSLILFHKLTSEEKLTACSLFISIYESDRINYHLLQYAFGKFSSLQTRMEFVWLGVSLFHLRKKQILIPNL